MMVPVVVAMSEMVAEGRLVVPCRLSALLADGRYVDIEVFNYGFDPLHRWYVTEFRFEGVTAASYFKSHFHQQKTCPDPASRLARDMECLEEALRNHFHVPMEDIEDCE